MATYEYIIRNETSGEGGGLPVAKVSSRGGADKPQQSGAQKTVKTLKTLSNLYVVREAVSITKSEFMYKANTVELRTGCKDLQQKVDFQMQLGQMGLNILGSAVAGFAVGGIIGAASAAGLSVLSQAIGFAQSTSQAQRTIDLKQSIEDNTIRMQMVRAGSRGSRGNYEQ